MLESLKLNDLCYKLYTTILEVDSVFFSAAHVVAARILYCIDNQLDPTYGILSDLAKLDVGFYIRLRNKYADEVIDGVKEICQKNNIPEPSPLEITNIFAFDLSTLGNEAFLQYIDEAKHYIGYDSTTPSLLSASIISHGTKTKESTARS